MAANFTSLEAQWIIQFKAPYVLEKHTLVISNNKIEDILPSSEAKQKYPSSNIIKLNNHALIPGLINTHNHAAMTLFRGMADDLPLMTWLNDHIWPAEGKWVQEEFVKDGTELAIAEMLLSGTTTYSDMYFFPEVSAQVIDKAGIKAQLCTPIMEFPTAWGSGPDEYIQKTKVLLEQYKNHPRISIAAGPHAPYTVSDETFNKCIQLKQDHGCQLQVHLHETQFEVDESLKQHNKRPIQRLHELGVLDQSTQCVHMTALTKEDIETISTSGAHLLHCPESNLKLASGFAPVHQAQEHGINIALGTDGAASNNDQDMLGEARSAALLAKAVSQNATALSALEALKAATLNGAKALGIDNKTGSLETGKLADIVAIDLSPLHCQPVYDPISQIIYAARADQVSNVWSEGHQLVKDKKLTSQDTENIINKARNWAEKIKETTA
ncbi:TRZ/ATZ family hydrolase [Litoribacillus peritrichatus]|uniref:TRZ/ATZ family hydrolase n=1 Tax=Litoribacillus peritrichatus TaxID=718191 RepID=A0ABP7MA26_9GAMM